MITLGQLKATGIAQQMGLCPDDAKFLSLANTAIERLMYAGDWWGTKRRVKLRVTDGNRIVLPMNVAAVERVSINGVPESLRGEAFEFLEGGYGVAEDQAGPTYRWQSPSQVVDSGVVATMTDPPYPSRISAYSDAIELDGTTITIQGYNQNGDWIRTQAKDGRWSEGEALILDPSSETIPPTTITDFKIVSAIIKPITIGGVVVSTNNLDGSGVLMSKMGPGTMTSQYRSYRIPRPSCEASGVCCAPVVTAIVKMGFVPVQNDRDVLSLWSLPAIQDGIWAEFYAQKVETEALRNAKMASALATLNMQLAHHRGSGQNNPLSVPDDGTFGASEMMPVYGYGG